MKMFLQLLAFLTFEALQVAFTASCVVLICPTLKQYLKLSILENIQSLFLLWQKNSIQKPLNLLHAIIFLDYLTKKVVKKNGLFFKPYFTILTFLIYSFLGLLLRHYTQNV